MTGNAMQLRSEGSVSPAPSTPPNDFADQARLVINTYPQCNSYTLDADVRIVSDFAISNEILQLFVDGGAGKIMFRPDGSIQELFTSTTTPATLTATYTQGTTFHLTVITDIAGNSWSIQIDSGTPETGSLTSPTVVNDYRFTGATPFQDTTSTAELDNIEINATGCNTPSIGTNSDILNQEATGPSGATIPYTDPVGSGANSTPVTVVCSPTSPVLVAAGATQQVDCGATDLLGQIASSSFDIGVVDTTGPTQPTNTSPTNGSIDNDIIPFFDWSDSTDTVGVDKYTLEIATTSGFGAAIIQTHVINPASEKQLVSPTDNLADDEYFWRVTATDAANNDSTPSATFSFTVDTTLGTPGNPVPSDTVINADEIATANVKVDVSDGDFEAADDVMLKYGAFVVGTLAVSAAVETPTSSGVFILTFDISGLADNLTGDTFTATAFDAAGNIQAAAAASANVIIDTEIGTPGNPSPSDTTYNALELTTGTVTVDVSDALFQPADTVTLRFGTATVNTLAVSAAVETPASSGIFILTFDISGVAETDPLGVTSKTFTATADDSAGNSQAAAAASADVIVDVTAPTYTAETGDQNPNTLTENKNKITLTFSESINNAGTVASTAWNSLPDDNGRAIATNGVSIGDGVTTGTLTLDGVLLTGNTPEVTHAPSPSNEITDIAGNKMVQTTTESVDGLAPTVVTTKSDDPIAEANTVPKFGPGGFSIKSVFSETMNTATTPVVSISALPDIDTTLSTINVGFSGWSMTDVADDTYTTFYDVADDDIMVTGTVASSDSGAADPTGNAQEPDASPLLARTFEVDTFQPFVTPTMTVTTNIASMNTVGTIADADVTGIGIFVLTITYNEPMITTGFDPDIAFTIDGVDDVLDTVTPTAVSDTLGTTYTGASWSGDSKTFTATYILADAGDDEDSVDVFSITGAKDAATNLQIDYFGGITEASGDFAIDTKNPTASLATNIGTIYTTLLSGENTLNDADTTTPDVLTATITFNEPMKTIAPTITFPNDNTKTIEGATESLAIITTPAGSAPQFTSTTVYVKNWNSQDDDETAPGIDIVITTSQDLVGNVMVPFNPTNDGANSQDLFGVDTENPRIPTSTLTIISDFTVTDLAPVGTTITITLDANEALDTPVNSDITIQGNAGGDTDVTFGLTGTDTLEAELVVDASDTNGVTRFSLEFRDLVKNAGDPDNSGSGGSIAITPEPATNAHITDASEVILDTVEAKVIGTFDIIGTTSTSDPTNLRTFARDVSLVFDCVDTNAAAIDVTGALDSSKVAGCDTVKIADDGLVGSFGGFEDLSDVGTTDTAKLTRERGTKTVLVQYKDLADNTDDTNSRTSTSIALDAKIIPFTVTDPTPSSPAAGEWEDVSFTMQGKVIHPLVTGTKDKMLVDFNFRLDTGALIRR